MIYMFISVMLKIVVEDGQYHNEQIKLESRINEICFGSVYNAHNFNLLGMLADCLNDGWYGRCCASLFGCWRAVQASD